jgi:hypothetical protein
MIGVFYVLFEVLKANPDDPLHLGPVSLVASLVVGWIAFQWIGATISMSAPVWAIQNLHIRASIRRARKLAKGSRFRIIVARLAPAIVGWILSFVVSYFLLLLRSSCLDYRFDRLYIRPQLFVTIIQWSGWCVSSAVVEMIRILSEAAILTVIGPIFPIALTLFYYDQRIRHEGYDIERMMESAGLTAPVTTPEKTELVTQGVAGEAHS